MNTAKTLSRPLARRVVGLDELLPVPASEPNIPQNVIQAAVDALARGETHYTDRPGIPEFRQWVADYLGKGYGIHIDPSQVTITCGSTEARYVTMTLLAQPQTQVLCLGDVAQIRGALHLVGAEPVHSMEDAERLTVLYLRPDDEREALDALFKQAEREDWWLVWDMSLATARPNIHPAQNEKLAARVVTIDSLSRRMAGWRLGWMAGSAAALRLRARKQAITICTTSVSQWAGLEFVRSGESW